MIKLGYVLLMLLCALEWAAILSDKDALGMVFVALMLPVGYVVYTSELRRMKEVTK